MMNCMIAGVGGQGTVLASKLIAAAAMKKGLDVRTTETIGMAQRGGSVVSHIRMGERISSPLIPMGGADVIMAFEPSEAVRILPFLKESGSLIVCDTAIKPIYSDGAYQAQEMLDFLNAHVEKTLIISGSKLTEQLGSLKTLNTALLGAAVRMGLFPFGEDELKQALHEFLPGKFLAMNLTAFEVGRSFCDE